jgi:hypothetical protein
MIALGGNWTHLIPKREHPYGRRRLGVVTVLLMRVEG